MYDEKMKFAEIKILRWICFVIELDSIKINALKEVQEKQTQLEK